MKTEKDSFSIITIEFNNDRDGAVSDTIKETEQACKGLVTELGPIWKSI